MQDDSGEGTPIPYSPKEGQINFADFNGDGLADLRMERYIWFSKGDGTFIKKTYAGIPKCIRGPFFLDVNQDGLSDYIMFEYNEGKYSIYLNKGEGDFYKFKNTDFDLELPTGEEISNSNFNFGDINGDGRPDLIWKRYYWLAEPNGTFGGINSYPPIEGRESLGIIERLYAVDFNCDGKSDLIGVSYHPQYPDTIYIQSYKNIHPEDVDGQSDQYFAGQIDLLKTIAKGNVEVIDFIMEYSYKTAYEEGAYLPFSLPVLHQVTIDDGFSTSKTTHYEYHGALYQDREFRGFADVTQIFPDERTIEVVEYGQDWHNKGMIKKITQQYDQINLKTIEYILPNAPQASQTNYCFVKPSSKLTSWYENGDIAEQVKEIFYYCDYNYYEESTDDNYNGSDAHGNLRYYKIYDCKNENDSIVNITKYIKKGYWNWQPELVTKLGINKIDDNANSTGVIRETEFQYDDHGNIIKKTFTLKDENGQDCAYPYVTRQYDPIYGNLLYAWDELGHKTGYYYDEQTNTFVVGVISPTTGNPSNPTQHNVYYQEENGDYYYQYGKPKIMIDENNNSTNYEIDGLGRIRSTVYPDDSEVSILYQDHTFPRYVKTTTRPNDDLSTQGVQTIDFFDGLNRKILTATKGYKRKEEGLKWIKTRFEYDNMGRLYKQIGPYISSSYVYNSREPRAENTCPIQVNEYDAHGRIERMIYKDEKDDEDDEDDEDEKDIVTKYEYNGFITTITDPDGYKKTVEKDFRGNIIKVTEEIASNIGSHEDYNQITNFNYNADNQLIRIEKKLSDGGTEYSVISKFYFDTLGRMVRKIDPDTGETIYTYYDNGLLKTQTDANLKTFTFNYDNLDRLTYKTSGVGTTHDSYVYDFPIVVNGIGQLFMVTNINATVTYNEYDPMGRVKKFSKKFEDGSEVTKSFVYDYRGALDTVTFNPNSPYEFIIKYNYLPDTNQLDSIESINLPENVVFATFKEYEQTGQIKEILYGNDLVTLYSRDPESSRLDEILTEPLESIESNTDDLRLCYEYKQHSMAGDIEEIIDHVNNIKYSYIYDSLHRIEEEKVEGKVAATNLKSISYNYDNDTDGDFHSPNNITVNWGGKEGFAERYDLEYTPNGNLYEGPDLSEPELGQRRNIDYNDENRPTSIEINQGDSLLTTISITYDGDGNRAKKENEATSQATYYIDKDYEIINDNPTYYVFANNLRIAQVVYNMTDYVVYYFHKDHLGSSTLITDKDGVKVQSSSYLAFGGEIDAPNNNISNYKYTDQEHDSETGLYNYDARLYDPALRMFISPDSIIPDYSNPQSLNRYAYCLNNPLLYTDPTGHESAIASGELNDQELMNIYMEHARFNDARMSVRDDLHDIDDSAVVNTAIDYAPIVGDLKGTVEAGIGVWEDPGDWSHWQYVGIVIGGWFGADWLKSSKNIKALPAPLKFGDSFVGKMRQHMREIRRTGKQLGFDIPKKSKSLGTQQAVKNYIEHIAREGTMRVGPYSVKGTTYERAIWSRLGDAIVVRKPDGSFLTFLDKTMGGAANHFPK